MTAPTESRSPNPSREGELLWTPSRQRIERTNMADYARWVTARTGVEFGEYEDLWRWSTRELDQFWETLRLYFAVDPGSDWGPVRQGQAMPGVEWFPHATLNFAERALAAEGRVPDSTAVHAVDESGGAESLSWQELRAEVGAAAAGLRRLGVGPGDRVAGYLPNRIETLIALLATASLGAIWSCVAPDLGAATVLSRFSQIGPKVLIAVDRYVFGGREFSRSDELERLRAQLPSLEATVIVGGRAALGPGAIEWGQLCAQREPFAATQVPFGHPLWIAFTSGTTGLPKGIVHSHGGVVLEQLKALGLHMDLGPQDTFFWYGSTSWIVWNILVSGLLCGATVVLYDGSPTKPDPAGLWRLAERFGVSVFGASAGYVEYLMKRGLVPSEEADLSNLREISTTGSPLAAEGFEWIYSHCKSDLWLAPICGGTDVATAFVGACPWRPVHAGEMQCRLLGVDAHSFDDAGGEVVGEVGELVVSKPMPSMPVEIWGDENGDRYRETYFDTYPGVWRHGDWIKITDGGTAVVYGRSDATINRFGVRTGTAEIYRVVEAVEGVLDSLVVEVARPEGESRLILFVVLAEGSGLDARLIERLASNLREELSPRHVPDEVVELGEVPRTLTGKKLEVPIRRILEGIPLDQALNADSVANPTALEVFVRLATDSPAGPQSGTESPDKADLDAR